MLRTIEKQTARLNKMIANLLDISRIERSQLAIEQAPFDLDATIERIVDEIRPTLRQHTIEYRNAAGSVWINGDELRLEQVLQNLVQNAVKYSPLGGPVRIEMSEQNGVMHILVRDNGIGIPSDALPQLFTRFYRAPNAEANHISGLGVGLYVAREIVRLHGGAITVSSEEGKGAEFTVSLPTLSERARLV
jgi:signal transduction histidine kinase